MLPHVGGDPLVRTVASGCKEWSTVLEGGVYAISPLTSIPSAVSQTPLSFRLRPQTRIMFSTRYCNLSKPIPMTYAGDPTVLKYQSGTKSQNSISFAACCFNKPITPPVLLFICTYFLFICLSLLAAVILLYFYLLAFIICLHFVTPCLIM